MSITFPSRPLFCTLADLLLGFGWFFVPRSGPPCCTLADLVVGFGWFAFRPFVVDLFCVFSDTFQDPPMAGK